MNTGMKTVWAFKSINWKFNRYDFWVHTILAEFTLWIIFMLLLSPQTENKTLAYIVLSIMLYIIIIAFVKRLRDLNKSAWFSLLLFIPVINIFLLIYCWFYKWKRIDIEIPWNKNK